LRNDNIKIKNRTQNLKLLFSDLLEIVFDFAQFFVRKQLWVQSNKNLSILKSHCISNLSNHDIINLLPKLETLLFLCISNFHFRNLFSKSNGPFHVWKDELCPHDLHLTNHAILMNLCEMPYNEVCLCILVSSVFYLDFKKSHFCSDTISVLFTLIRPCGQNFHETRIQYWWTQQCWLVDWSP